MHSLIERACQDSQPSGFLDYRLYLESLYSHVKRANPSYSYLKFSQDLGFKATTVMHQIIRGYRPLTFKAAERICKALALKELQKDYLLALVAYCNAGETLKRQQALERLLALQHSSLVEELDKDKLNYFSQWYHPVIWELVGSTTFKADPTWIAQSIVPSLKKEQVESSLALLTRLGLVTYDDTTKTYCQTTQRVSTGHRVQGMALLSYHQQMLERSQYALMSLPGKRRDISAITINIDEETAVRIKKMIYALQLQILDEAQRCGKGDQIYQVNIQLFPFTK